MLQFFKKAKANKIANNFANNPGKFERNPLERQLSKSLSFFVQGVLRNADCVLEAKPFLGETTWVFAFVQGKQFRRIKVVFENAPLLAGKEAVAKLRFERGVETELAKRCLGAWAA